MDYKGESIVGKYVVISEEYLSETKKDISFRVIKATGGFGCNPTGHGNAIYSKSADGSEFRAEAYMLERFATEEEIAMFENRVWFPFRLGDSVRINFTDHIATERLVDKECEIVQIHNDANYVRVKFDYLGQLECNFQTLSISLKPEVK